MTKIEGPASVTNDVTEAEKKPVRNWAYPIARNILRVAAGYIFGDASDIANELATNEWLVQLVAVGMVTVVEFIFIRVKRAGGFT